MAYTKCIATLWHRLIYLFIYLFVYESRASVTWSSVVVLVVSLGSSNIACVASVSVGFGSKERPRNGVFGILPARKMGREPKKER